jgi:hypothetical protein
VTFLTNISLAAAVAVPDRSHELVSSFFVSASAAWSSSRTRFVFVGLEAALHKALSEDELAVEAPLTEEEWAHAEEEVLQRLRDVFRKAWNLPHLRHVLSRTSNVMVHSLGGIFAGIHRYLDKLATHDEFNGHGAFDLESSKEHLYSLHEYLTHPLSQMSLTKMALQVYVEYQRQLWDPTCVKREEVVENDDSTAEGAEPGNNTTGEGGDGGDVAVDGAIEMKDDPNSIPDVQLEFEHHAFSRQYGDSVLLVLDIVSSRLTEDYHVDPHAPLLGDAQWEEIARVLQLEGVLALVIACDAPFVWEPGKSSYEAQMDTEQEEDHAAKFRGKELSSDRWSSHEDELVALLEALFDWKVGAPGRDVLLSVGGTRCGVVSDIVDDRHQQKIVQVASGTVAGQCVVFSQPEKGRVGERFAYHHRPWTSPADVPDTDAAATAAVSSTTAAAQATASGSEAAKPSDAAPTLTTGPVVVAGVDAGAGAGMVMAVDGQPTATTTVATDDTDSNYDRLLDTGPVEGQEEAKLDPEDAEEADGEAEEKAAMLAAVRQSRSNTYAQIRLDIDPEKAVFSHKCVGPQQEELAEVLVGPVIGKLGAVACALRSPRRASANILLEVDRVATVTCVVVDALLHRKFQIQKRMPARRPVVFRFKKLVPERRYYVSFVGVGSPKRHTGIFATPHESPRKMNFLAVASNTPINIPTNQKDVWSIIKQRTDVAWNGIDVLVHVGAQVRLTDAFKECLVWLKQKTAESAPDGLDEGNRSAAEDIVCDRLREVYRQMWSQPHTKEIVGCCSNLMGFSAADLCHAFNRELDAGGVRRGDAEVEFVLQCAKRVYAEFQRQLWDDDLADELARTKGSSKKGKTGSKDKGAPAPLAEGKQKKKKKASPGGGKRKSGRDATPMSAGGEEHFHRWGDIGLVFLDTLTDPNRDGELITCGGDYPKGLEPKTDFPFMGETQWRWLLEILSVNTKAEDDKTKFKIGPDGNGLKSLVVVSEVPFLYCEPADARNAAKDKKRNSFIFDYWVHRPKQLASFLDLVFKWRDAEAGREVVLLCAGLDCGVETTITDVRLKSDMQQLVVGPVSAAPQMFRPRYDGAMRRFTFKHAPQLQQRNYGIIEITLIDEEKDPLGMELDDLDSDDDEEEDDKPPTILASMQAQLVTEANADKVHDPSRMTRYPEYWPLWAPRTEARWWSDMVYLRSGEWSNFKVVRKYIREDAALQDAIKDMYFAYHMDDTTRPPDMQTIDASDPEVMLEQLHRIMARLHESMPEEVQSAMALLHDKFVVNYTLLRTGVNLTEAIDEVEFVGLCHFMIDQAGIMQVAAYCQEMDEERILDSFLDGERARLAEVERKRQQRLKEEKLDAEIESVRKFDPIEYQNIMGLKKKAEKQRQQNEQLAKLAREKEAYLEKVEAKNRRKMLIKERKREKERADQEEQDELNRLAESDPAEYDRRVKEIVERQAVEAAKLKGSVAEQKKRKERVAKNKRKQKKQDAKDKDAADMKERAKQFK